MSLRPKRVTKLILAFFIATQFYGIASLFPKQLESSNLQSVSDTLSSNRLSFRGELNGAVAQNSGIVVIKTSGLATANTSSGSAALMEGDTLRVGNSSSAYVGTVRTIESASRIVLAAGLSTAASDGDPVISTASAIHTVRFTPSSTIPNGAFRVLLAASATQTNSGDGLPDKDGFDLITGSLPTVSCSGGGSGYTFETGTASVSAATVGGNYYHSFECRYRGNGGTSTGVIMAVGTAAGNKVLNPSPASTSRNPGAVDTYLFKVRHTEGTDGSYAVVDETTGRVGVVEAVRVTATVAPTLTFTLTGVASGVTACTGVSTDVTTTVNSVPLGTLSTSAFADGAQLLSVSTNAAGGYSVTASESAALTAWSVSGTPTIADTTCGATPCTVTAGQNWTDTTYKGFGYSLHDVAGDAVSTANEDGANFKARPFGTTTQQIMSDTAPADTDQAYVCYRAVISGTQQAGDYENYVIYIATATF